MLKFTIDKSVNQDDKGSQVDKCTLMDADDTLRGLLLKNILQIELDDELFRAVLGRENATLRPGDLIGITGANGSGKSIFTQHMLSYLILPREIGGSNLEVLYIDTDNAFFLHIFVEKHLIPAIEARMSRLESIANKNKYLDEIIKYNKDKSLYVNIALRACLDKLRVIQASDLLDLLCILRKISLCARNSTVLIIDSINFWNSDINSLVVNKRDLSVGGKHEKNVLHYIFGCYTNKNTVFNSIYSLIKHVANYHGFVCILTINEHDSHFSLDHKIKSNVYSEEFVELENLFIRENGYGSDNNKESSRDMITLKFLSISDQNTVKNNIHKIFGLEEYYQFRNIIWMARSSPPVSGEIHYTPNSPIIPSYFVCVNTNSLSKTFISFDDYNGLILL